MISGCKVSLQQASIKSCKSQLRGRHRFFHKCYWHFYIVFVPGMQESHFSASEWNSSVLFWPAWQVHRSTSTSEKFWKPPPLPPTNVKTPIKNQQLSNFTQMQHNCFHAFWYFLLLKSGPLFPQWISQRLRDRTAARTHTCTHTRIHIPSQFLCVINTGINTVTQ